MIPEAEIMTIYKHEFRRQCRSEGKNGYEEEEIGMKITRMKKSGQE